MKNIIEKSASKQFFLLLVLLSSAFLLEAQIKKERKINKTFSGKNNVKIEHTRGPVYVVKSTNNEVKLDITISVEVMSEADAKVVLDNISVDIEDVSNHLVVESKTNIQNYTSTNRGTKIKFKNGTTVKNARNIKSVLTLHVPDLEKLFIANKYDDVNIEDGLTTDLSLNVYSGRVDIGNIGGNLDLEMKYSKGEIGDFQDGVLDIYDCNLRIGTGKVLNLKSKYSELKLKEFTKADLICYDDNLEIGNIAGDLTLTDKYSEFEFGNFKNAKMDLYDSNITLENGNDLQLKSKYSEIKLQKLGSLNFELSYDDNTRVNELGSFYADSKYSEFSFGLLESGLTMNSYDDDVRVTKFTGPLKTLKFVGKYSELDMAIPSSISYKLEASMTYGKLDFPKDKFNTRINSTNSSKFEFKGAMKDSNDSSPTIEIEAYDCKIDLN